MKKISKMKRMSIIGTIGTSARLRFVRGNRMGSAVD
jgi:hypothetical protein